MDAGIDGSGNDVMISQDGSNNFIDGSTPGLFDADGLTIVGSRNTVDVSQRGSNNMSTKSIIGNGNNVTVSQSN